MASKCYIRYRAGGFRTNRPLRSLAAAEKRASTGRRASAARNSIHPARVIKWIATLFMVVSLGVVLYVAGSIGYGYLQNRNGQQAMRSLFSITGNGSVDPDYLRREAEALDARLHKLDPVGEIDIPSIGSRWMIVEGADGEALKKGPGHIRETTLPGAGGNFAVAGDRVLYGAPFLHLDDVAVGDTVTVKTPYATFTYRVTESFIVTPDDTSVLEPVGYEAITLLTCDPLWDVKRRIIIRGELEDVQPAGTTY